MTVRTLTLSLALLLAAGTARAQSFPIDEKWAPLPCGDATMIDDLRDQSGATGERDIVGDPISPAGFRAADDTYVYLRMRVDADPAPGRVPRPFAWGFAIDLDGNRSTYELLIVADGAAKRVAVHRNTTTTSPNDPADPADDPPVVTFPFETHARSIPASSSYAGDPDYFLDVAVPWSTLEPLSVTRTTPLVVWAATSSTSTALNGDLACHQGSGGAPRLSVIAPPPTTLDPNVDSDRDGWSDADEVTSGTDPRNPSSRPSGTPPPLGTFASAPVLEGAGGCAFGGGARAGAIAGMMVAALALFVTRARRGNAARG